MRISPLDVQSHRFARRLNGYDRDEVDAFLRMVADDYESLVRDNESLIEKVRRLETRVESLAANETLLKETLLSAQSVTEDIRRTAVKESEVLISEAEVMAEKVLDASHRRAARLSEDIREMRGLRLRMAESLRATIETHLKLIDSLEQDPEGVDAVEGKITYLTRKRTGRVDDGQGGG